MTSSREFEQAIIDVLDRTSVYEVLSAQYYMFVKANNRTPQLIQVSNRLKPMLWREMSAMFGISIDQIASARVLMIEAAVLQFSALPADQFARIFASKCEPVIL